MRSILLILYCKSLFCMKCLPMNHKGAIHPAQEPKGHIFLE